MVTFVNPLFGRIDLRDDSGSSAVSTLIKVVVFVGIPGVLAFDALSCFVNGGLADGVAEGAARSAGNSATSRDISNQEAYNQAAAYLAEQEPAYSVLPESVRVDPVADTVALSVQRTAPTVVFKYAEFSREWTHIEASGSYSYGS